MSSSNLYDFLEDFIEGLKVNLHSTPTETIQDLTLMKQKDVAFEEKRKGVRKYMSAWLRAQGPNGILPQQQDFSKEIKSALIDIDEKIRIGEEASKRLVQLTLALDEESLKRNVDLDVSKYMTMNGIEYSRKRKNPDDNSPVHIRRGSSEEKLYCICKEISYGDMIACDNRNCTKEWFHYSCVGLKDPPTGKWFCTECKIKAKEKSKVILEE